MLQCVWQRLRQLSSPMLGQILLSKQPHAVWPAALAGSRLSGQNQVISLELLASLQSQLHLQQLASKQAMLLSLGGVGNQMQRLSLPGGRRLLFGRGAAGFSSYPAPNSSSSASVAENGSSSKLQHHSRSKAALQRPFFWNNLSSKIKSRKPAIKWPARHQWHYCNPDYDPMAPKLEQPLPPYAPERAHHKNYRQLYFDGRPRFRRSRWVSATHRPIAVADNNAGAQIIGSTQLQPVMPGM